ncbi:MAG: DUF6505 family protein [Alphaproteobacteria bacterium]|jgi:hypothetical protein|nr:DUF6505 family protein [Alphaproteobacteria bacterium]
MRLPRTIRLDSSDDNVFERAARPGEWAVSGAFAFSDVDFETLDGKGKQAYACGFLGTFSFGRATFVEVAEATNEEVEAVVTALADHFVAEYGAPDRAAALPVAEEEVEFAAGLCEHKLHTLLRVEREPGEAGVIERFSAVQTPGEPEHAKIWNIVEDDNG